MKHLSAYIAAAMTATLIACNSQPQWKIDGKIQGAENRTMALEANNGAQWYLLDSVKINAHGQFSATQDAPGYSDIYRLRLDDKALYFPIDSIETVTIVSDINSFDTDFTLSGSDLADMLMDADHRISQAFTKGDAMRNDSTFKRELGQIILRDPGSIVSYYIINKRIGGKPLFDPSSPMDRRLIGAVANAFMQKRPGDARTAMLSEMYLSNRPAPAKADTITASVNGLIDIPLSDAEGNLKTLAQTAAKHPVVILSFTAYTADFAPALNVMLNRVYDKYRSRGLEIYQVGYDGDEYKWRQAAKNLPWTTVYNPITVGDTHLRNYNVGQLPAIYVIADGTIVKRITDVNQIESTVAKYL